MTDKRKQAPTRSRRLRRAIVIAGILSLIASLFTLGRLRRPDYVLHRCDFFDIDQPLAMIGHDENGQTDLFITDWDRTWRVTDDPNTENNIIWASSGSNLT
ncbi:MAG: hypothetical protein AAF125_14605, partial [Chloroflexota bacterium]